MKKYYKKFLVYLIKDKKRKLLMEFQFFDKYVLKIQSDKKIKTFLDFAKVEAIIDTLQMSNFPNVEYVVWEDEKEKTLLEKLKRKEKIIL